MFLKTTNPLIIEKVHNICLGYGFCKEILTWGPCQLFLWYPTDLLPGGYDASPAEEAAWQGLRSDFTIPPHYRRGVDDEALDIHRSLFCTA